MRNFILSLCLLICTAYSSLSQIQPLTLTPDGGNKKASVSEQIGIVKIVVSYSRPGVKGREGKIWNTPVAHYGFVDLGHGTSYAAPWRAGSNENTTISFSHPVKIEADVHGLQIASFKSELRTTRPYYDFISAANYCLANNVELEQALAWMDRAIYFRVMGEKNFRGLSTKAAILTKLNRADEAKKLMEEALPMGTMLDVHF